MLLLGTFLLLFKWIRQRPTVLLLFGAWTAGAQMAAANVDWLAWPE
jgi:hypothetical protein